MNLLQIILCSIVVWIYIYSLVDRICKCVEHRADAKLFDRYLSNPDALLKFLKRDEK